MRTISIFFILTLLLTLAACGGKEVEEPMAESAAIAEAPAPTEEAVAKTDGDDSGSSRPIKDILPVGPVGTVQLKDGTVIELTRFEKIGKYYLYISGKLNGRSSTVISFTRYQDVARWKTIMFKDKHNFLIISKKGKELAFLDSRLYIGSDSGDTFSFFTTDRNLDEEIIEVKKDDVATININ